MKKWILMLLVMSCLVLVLAQSAAATTTAATSGAVNETINWSLDSTGTLTISGTGDLTVYESSAPWRDVRGNVTSIVIEEGITAITNNAFASCYKAASVSIAGSVKTIGNYAFDGICATTLTIPEGVEYIGTCAFYDVDELTSVSLPASLTRMGNYPFQFCENLKTITLAEGNTAFTLADGVLFSADMTKLVLYPTGDPRTSYTVPSSVTEIADRAFKLSKNLKSVTLPEGITKISNALFEDCENLASVNIPENVTMIDGWAFSNCSSLTNLEIPSGVTYISNQCFSGCSKLTTLKIPSGVTRISSNTFTGCKLLDGIVIPDGVTTIDYSAFSGCESLTGINIPDTVETIDGSAFSGCKSLTTVSIPDSVTTLGSYAFSGCEKLETVVLPRKLDSLYSGTFYNCKALKSVTFRSAPPTNTDSVAESMFTQADSETLVLYYPSYAQTEWESSAWKTYYTLEMYTMTGVVATGTWGSLTWSLTAEGVLTISGQGPMDPYGYWDDDLGWRAEGNGVKKVIVEAGITTIGEYAFRGLEAMTELQLPVGVTSLGGDALAGCTGLKKIVVPATVTTFGYSYSANNFFANCPDVTIYGYDRSHAKLYADKFDISWESLGNAPVKTVKILPADPEQGRTHSVVEEEIRAALQDHTKIILADGVYEMTQTLEIAGLIDVTIAAENPGGAELLLFVGYDPVVELKYMYSSGSNHYPSFIDLNGLILGHDNSEKTQQGCDGSSYTRGYVVCASNANYVTIDTCDMWGCGIYAVYMSYCENVTVKNSVLRDCVYSAVYANNSKINFTDCIISGNAYREAYRDRPCVELKESAAGKQTLTFKNCKFFNNHNASLMTTTTSLTEAIFDEACAFFDNAWQGDTPRYYGVCVGDGVVWEAVANDAGGYDLFFNREITYVNEDGEEAVVLSSKSGEVPAYSDPSAPWSKLIIGRQALTPGTTMNVVETDSQTGTETTFAISYENTEVSEGVTYHFMYVLYNADGRMLDMGLETMEFNGDLCAEFELAAQDAGVICRIYLLSEEAYALQCEIAQLKFRG